jgi:hypothetical protein
MPRREDHPSPEELRREAKQVEEHGETPGKRPSNVAGGKKAAAARKEHKSRGSRSSHEE